MLNPDQSAFCIGDSKPSVDLPIRINQTHPISMELLRIDLDTNANETFIVTAKDVSRLRKQADRLFDKRDVLSPRFLQYPVKKTGLYRLQKVIDESRLEVQRRLSDTLVVRCPTAMVKAAPRDKCKGALTDFYLQVDATPPFKIKYSKTVNRDDHGHVLLSIHPENLVSPLAAQRTSGALVPSEQSATIDVSWAQSQRIEIPLNESLGVSGGWQYTIDEVHDACGNIANYSQFRLMEPRQHSKPSKDHQYEQHFFVHERPRVSLRGYDSQHPIKVEKGRSKILPLEMSSIGPSKLGDAPYSLSYLFTPQEDTFTDQKHSATAIRRDVIIKDVSHGLEVRDPGLYTLYSISTAFCEGEVMEPSSCLLLNPPEPSLTISSEIIPDKCAGSSIGLLVDLDLFGTPPFHIFYDIKQTSGGVTPMIEKVDRLHSQIELKPTHAGHYTYEFHSISDAVYRDRRPLLQKRTLEQDVRPPAAARILDAHPVRKACIEEPVVFAIQIMGEPPYSIEYEIIHRGRRKKNTAIGIEDNIHRLTTYPLKEGGEYTLALTSVMDRSGCKVYLKDEAKVDVSLQRPRAAFGHLNGKRSISALEAKKIALPLRLQGEPPWTVVYRNMNNANEHLIEKTLHSSNDQIEVATEGTYQILEVQDATCPGSVDTSASQFILRWIPRPSMQLSESSAVELKHDRYVKKDICEGDEDVTEVSFTGTAPFNVEYQQRLKSDRGLQSMSPKKFNAGLNMASLRMETSEAGLYEYKFSKLGDMSYTHDHRKFTPFLVQQRVHPRPSASFAQAGKTYKYCQEEEAGGEVVPINLVGEPPFHLELEIRHHATAKPEVINVPNVESSKYNLHVPHSVLALGTHSVTIRKVQDSRGCQRKMGFNAPHIQISVADIPSISPLEERIDYCVGDRISYALSGTPPFNVFYTFEDRERKASVPSTTFRRIAEKPGDFVITALSDQRSTDACKAKTHITKVIHEMPSVRVSKGRTATVDIHEGGEAEILFEFGGTPPFHFT